MQAKTLRLVVALLAWPAAALAAPAGDPIAAFSRDGRTLAVLDGKGTVRLWDVATGKEGKSTTLALGKEEVARQVSYNRDGDLVVRLCQMTDEAFSARPWNLVSDKRSPSIRTRSKIGLGVAVCPKGELLAYGDGLWDVATGKKLRTVALPGGMVFKIKFSPDGKTVLYQISESLAQDFAFLILADATTGKKLVQIGEIDLEKQDVTSYFSSEFSPDGKWLGFSEEARPALHLWDMARGKVVRRIALKQSVQVVGFSPDSSTLVSWDHGGPLRLWETVTGRERKTINLEGKVDDVLLSPDGKWAAVRKGNAVELRGLTD